MNQIKNILYASALALFLANPLFAHEGHDHGTPGVMKAPHGGITKGGENVDIELVQNEGSILIYGLTADSKTIAPGEFQISGTVMFPKTKAEALSFSAKSDHYYGKLSFTEPDGKPRGHRAEVVLKVTPKDKKAESFTYQLEPQN
jgi:hypothetical protein